MRTRLYLKSKLGHIARYHISPSEGARLESNGQAVREKRLVNGKYMLVGYKMRELLRDDHSSPTGITCSEMKAACGMASNGATRAAQAKIAEWPILTAQFRAEMTVCA